MNYYHSFDFKHVTTINIPELGLLEQDVQMTIEMDGYFEEYHIDEVCIYDWCPVINARNPVPITDPKVLDAVIERFKADPVAEDMMFERGYSADYELNGRI